MSTISSLSSQYGYSTRLYGYGQQNQNSGGSTVDELMRQASDTQETQREQSRRQESYGLAFDPGMMQAMMDGGQQMGTTQDQSEMIAAMDTDSDGTITKEEFVGARPDDVSESMAENLWNSFDTESAGSLSTDDLQTAMAKGPHGPPPPPPSDDTSEDDSSSDLTETDPLQSILSQLLNSTKESEETGLSDQISAMDTDGDGTVTKEEFVAARPDDVSESMAENLWDRFDTEGIGSLSTTDLQTAMESSPPPEGPDGMGGPRQAAFQSLLDQLESSSTTTEETTTTDSTTSSQNTALQALLEAIKAYDSTAGYEATKNVLSSVMSLA
jgi:Ca2+-binding EF-hand superfamily protein